MQRTGADWSGCVHLRTAFLRDEPYSAAHAESPAKRRVRGHVDYGSRCDRPVRKRDVNRWGDPGPRVWTSASDAADPADAAMEPSCPSRACRPGEPLTVTHERHPPR